MPLHKKLMMKGTLYNRDKWAASSLCFSPNERASYYQALPRMLASQYIKVDHSLTSSSLSSLARQQCILAVWPAYAVTLVLQSGCERASLMAWEAEKDVTGSEAAGSRSCVRGTNGWTVHTWMHGCQCAKLSIHLPPCLQMAKAPTPPENFSRLKRV